jgi:hypothetical protein
MVNNSTYNNKANNYLSSQLIEQLPLISTHWTITSHLNSLNNYLSSQLIEHKKHHDIQCLKLGTSLGQAQKLWQY